MPDTVTLTLLDHARARIDADPGILMELSDHLTFEVEGAQFDPRVRKGEWDGTIRLVDRRSRTVPVGLAQRVRAYCEKNGYEYRDSLRKPQSFTSEEANAFIDTLGIPAHFDRRDYQVEAFRTAVETGRQLFVSPTSSGKSMIIYTVARWYGLKTLIVVPTTGLTIQFRDDIASYGYDPSQVSIIGGGEETDFSAQIIVSTWQSAYEMEPEWFDQFGLIIGDEAHLFTAQSLTGIMNKARRTALRFGFTGTLKGSKCHQLQLEGLFGPTTVVTTTRELMDRGYVAQLQVECVCLSHPEGGRKALQDRIAEARASPKYKKMKRGALAYMQEVQHLYGLEARNRFIVKMASRLKGNVLILFHHVEHGDRLHDMLVQETDRTVHLVNGGVDGLERNEIRALIERSDDAILVASVGTSSTGVSIKKINYMILASPWKSRIVTLQSVGRGLRTSDEKQEVTIYDVGDDLSWKGKPNHTLKHMSERIKIYASEDFSYRVHRVDLPY